MLRQLCILALVGCGDNAARTPADAKPLPDSPLLPDAPQDASTKAAGEHSHYVVNALFVPTNNQEARDDGLDLNGDGTVDNQLGMVLGTLFAYGVSVQAAVDTAVAQGSLLQLVDLQTSDYANDAAAGFALYVGDNPSTPPCSDGSDPVCGHHLDGHTSFGIAASSPHDPPLTGPLVGGTLTSAPGNLHLALVFGAAPPHELSLIGARVVVTGASATGVTSAIIGGAIAEADVNAVIIPAVHDESIAPILARDCPGATAADAPACKCANGSSGKQLIALFDTSPSDCAISLDEIAHNSLLGSLFAPDVTINAMPAFSLGVKVTTVAATFPQP